jgi:hypothetical protein
MVNWVQVDLGVPFNATLGGPGGPEVGVGGPGWNPGIGVGETCLWKPNAVPGVGAALKGPGGPARVPEGPAGGPLVKVFVDVGPFKPLWPRAAPVFPKVGPFWTIPNMSVGSEIWKSLISYLSDHNDRKNYHSILDSIFIAKELIFYIFTIYELNL